MLARAIVAKANLGTSHHAVALGPLAHAPWAVSPAPSFKDIFAPVLWGTTVCVHTMQARGALYRARARALLLGDAPSLSGG